MRGIFSWPIKIFISYRLGNNPIFLPLLIFPSSPQNPLRENLSNPEFPSRGPRPSLGEIKTNFCLLCLSFICQKDLCLEKGIYNADRGVQRPFPISFDNVFPLFFLSNLLCSSCLTSKSDKILKIQCFQDKDRSYASACPTNLKGQQQRDQISQPLHVLF